MCRGGGRQSDDGGEWPVALERHDGGRGGRFGRESAGSDEGVGSSGRFGSGRGRGARVAKRRGLVVVRWRWPKWREGRVGRPGWKERWAAARLNPEPSQNSKEILFEFQLILEFGRTLEICTRRFRKKFDMRIFPKVF
jgi:hypothetical protein